MWAGLYGAQRPYHIARLSFQLSEQRPVCLLYLGESLSLSLCLSLAITYSLLHNPFPAFLPLPKLCLTNTFSFPFYFPTHLDSPSLHPFLNSLSHISITIYPSPFLHIHFSIFFPQLPGQYTIALDCNDFSIQPGDRNCENDYLLITEDGQVEGEGVTR